MVYKPGPKTGTNRNLEHIKNIHLHRCKHKTVKLKLTLTLTLTLTDTGGAVQTLMLGYRRLRNYKQEGWLPPTKRASVEIIN